MQIQIRSGDEPMTTFYKARMLRTSRARPAPPLTARPQCVACKHQWREG
jgi:DNA-directed RNA polymerase subunit M/transcription elongation factor TFIIS